MSVLQRQGIIASWHDRRITAGKELHDEIDKHLQSANLILLLVSPDFLASDYCYGIEMTHAMERHDAGDATVVPIILRPCYWENAPFSKLAALPKDALPVTSSKWGSIDEGFADVARGIATAARGFAPAKHQTLANTDGKSLAVPVSHNVKVEYYLTHLPAAGQDGWDIVSSFVTIVIDNIGEQPLNIRHVMLTWQHARSEDGPPERRVYFVPERSGPIPARRPIHAYNPKPPCTISYYWPVPPEAYSGPVLVQSVTCARRCGSSHGKTKSINYSDGEILFLSSAAFADPATIVVEVWADEDENNPVWIGRGAKITDLQFLIRQQLEHCQEIK